MCCVIVSHKNAISGQGAPTGSRSFGLSLYLNFHMLYFSLFRLLGFFRFLWTSLTLRQMIAVC